MCADPPSTKLPDAAFSFARVNCWDKSWIFELKGARQEPPVTRDWKGRVEGLKVDCVVQSSSQALTFDF